MRAPHVGQRRSLRRRLACGRGFNRERGLPRSLSAREARELERTGCSQNVQRLAVWEIKAPQCGQDRLPLSLRSETRARGSVRLGAGSATPHIRQVRAEALTSAPQCEQVRLRRKRVRPRSTVARTVSIQAGNCTSRSPAVHPARARPQCPAWPATPCRCGHSTRRPAPPRPLLRPGDSPRRQRNDPSTFCGPSEL